MNIIDLISKLVSKDTKPKVYAVNVWVGDQSFLHLLLAYSLEEAFVKTKYEFKRIYPKIDINNAELKQFCCVEPEFLFNQVEGAKKVEAPLNSQIIEEVKTVITDVPLKKVEEVKKVEKKEEVVPVITSLDKNVLMKQILESNDLKKVEEHKAQLSEVEYQYLVGKISSGNSKK